MTDDNPAVNDNPEPEPQLVTVDCEAADRFHDLVNSFAARDPASAVGCEIINEAAAALKVDADEAYFMLRGGSNHKITQDDSGTHLVYDKAAYQRYLSKLQAD